jgi:hypothetical protein
MAIETNDLEIKPLFKLKALFDEKLGAGMWKNYEPETILVELEVFASDLLIDKISLLRILENAPLMAYQDPGLFLYAAEVISNQAADFEVIPHLMMLEAAYAVHSIDRVLLANKITPVYPDALIKTCAYFLRNDGCSEPLAPFIFVPKDELVAGQTKEDTDNKKKAVALYLAHMDTL